MIAKIIMAKKNLKQSVILGASISTFVSISGVSIAIPIAQKNQERLNALSHNFSEQFQKFAKQLGMTGKDIHAEFGDYILLKILPDGGKVFRKKGESKTIIIGGNSASTLDGAAAAKLIKVLIDAKKNLAADSSLLNDIMAPVIKRSQKTSTEISSLIEKYIKQGNTKEQSIKLARNEVRKTKSDAKVLTAKAIDKSEAKSVDAQTKSVMSHTNSLNADARLNSLIKKPINWMTMYAKSYALKSIGSSFRKKIENKVITQFGANATAIKTITDVIGRFSTSKPAKISSVLDFYDSSNHQTGLTAFKISNEIGNESRYIILNSKKNSNPSTSTYTSKLGYSLPNVQIQKNSFISAKVFIANSTGSTATIQDSKKQVDQIKVLSELSESVNADVRNHAEKKLLEGVNSSEVNPYAIFKKDKALTIGSILNQSRYETQHSFFKGVLNEILDGETSYDNVHLNDFADVIDKAVDSNISTDGFFSNLKKPLINGMITGVQKLWKDMSPIKRKWLADNKLLLFLALDTTNNGLNAAGIDYTTYASKLFENSDNKKLLNKIKNVGGNISEDIKSFVTEDIANPNTQIFDDKLKNVRTIASKNQVNFNWYVKHDGVLGKMIKDTNMQVVVDSNMKAIDDLKIHNDALNDILGSTNYESKISRFTTVNDSVAKTFILNHGLIDFAVENDKLHVNTIEKYFKDIKSLSIYSSKQISQIIKDDQTLGFIKKVAGVNWLIEKKSLIKQMIKDKQTFAEKFAHLSDTLVEQSLDNLGYSESTISLLGTGTSFDTTMSIIKTLGQNPIASWVEKNALTNSVINKMKSDSVFLPALEKNYNSLDKLGMSLSSISNIIENSRSKEFLANASGVANSKFLSYYVEKDVTQLLIEQDSNWLHSLDKNMGIIQTELKFDHLQLMSLISSHDVAQLSHINAIRNSSYKDWLIKNHLVASVMKEWKLFDLFKVDSRRKSIDDLGLTPDKVFTMVDGHTMAKVSSDVDHIKIINEIFVGDHFTWLKKYNLVSFALNHTNIMKELFKDKDIHTVKTWIERVLPDSSLLNRTIKGLDTVPKVQKFIEGLKNINKLNTALLDWIRDHGLLEEVFNNSGMVSTIVTNETVKSFKHIWNNDLSKLKTLIANKNKTAVEEKINSLNKMNKLKDQQFDNIVNLHLMDKAIAESKVDIIIEITAPKYIEAFKLIWQNDMTRIKNLVDLSSEERETRLSGLLSAVKTRTEVLEKEKWLSQTLEGIKNQIAISIVGTGVTKAEIDQHAKWLADKKFDVITSNAGNNVETIKILLINKLAKTTWDELLELILKNKNDWINHTEAFKKIISILNLSPESEDLYKGQTAIERQETHISLIKKWIKMYKQPHFFSNVWLKVFDNKDTIKNIFDKNIYKDFDTTMSALNTLAGLFTAFGAESNMNIGQDFWQNISKSDVSLEKILSLGKHKLSDWELSARRAEKNSKTSYEFHDKWVNLLKQMFEEDYISSSHYFDFVKGMMTKGLAYDHFLNAAKNWYDHKYWNTDPSITSSSKKMSWNIALERIKKIVADPRMTAESLDTFANFVYLVGPDFYGDYTTASKWMGENLSAYSYLRLEKYFNIWARWIRRAKLITNIYTLSEGQSHLVSADLEEFEPHDIANNKPIRVLFANATTNKQRGDFEANGFERRIIYDLLSDTSYWTKLSEGEFSLYDTSSKLYGLIGNIVNNKVFNIDLDKDSHEVAKKKFIAFARWIRNNLHGDTKAELVGYAKRIYEKGLYKLSLNGLEEYKHS